MCARETFVGFPLRVQSKAANGGPDFCGAKISSTKREPPFGWLSFGASSGIRTPDTLLKRQVLCLLSYWGMSGWDGGTRTHYIRVKV